MVSVTVHSQLNTTAAKQLTNHVFIIRTIVVTVKVWYPAIRAHILARRLGLKTYYKALKIGIPLTSSTSKSSVDAGTTSFEVEKGVYKPNEDDVKRAVQIGRGHKFEHPMGVVSVKKFRAGFDDCEYSRSGFRFWW